VSGGVGIKRQNVSTVKNTGSLWRSLIKALVGALVVGIVAAAFLYGFVTFNTQPRLSAAITILGIAAFIYMSVGLGRAIAAMEGLRSTRAQQNLPKERAKSRFG
jgi:O-antigen/teichoic acid export membrane protein